MTKCHFNTYGSSGDVDTRDTICILPINMVYEKIFIFLWYWTIILGFLTALHLLSRLFTIVSMTYRKYIATNHVRTHYRAHAYFIVSKCGFGDWLILLRLLENLNGMVMEEIMREIRMQILGQRLPAIQEAKGEKEAKNEKEAKTEPGKKSEFPPLLPPRNDEVVVEQEQRIYEKVLA